MRYKKLISLLLMSATFSVYSTGITSIVAFAEPQPADTQSQEVESDTSETDSRTQEQEQDSQSAGSDGLFSQAEHPMYYNPTLTPIVQEIQELDSKISFYTAKQEEMKLEVDKINNKIDQSKKQVILLRKEIDKEEKLAGERIKEIHNYNLNLVYLDTLLSSKNLSDFFFKASAISKILKYDKQTILSLEEKRDSIDKLVSEQEKDKEKVDKLLTEITDIADELKEKKVEVMEKVKEAMENATFKIKSQECIDIEEELKEKYKDYAFTNFTPHSYTNFPSAENITPDKVSPYAPVQDKFILDLDNREQFTQTDLTMFATSLLGIQYIWGGTDISGMDCSGFVGYVYRHFGVYLPRVSESQQFVGTQLTDEDELQTGDLLFYGNPAHHVTMYLCPGYMLEAPQSGDVIRVSEIRPYTSATRIITWDSDGNAIAANTTLEDWTPEELEKIQNDYKAKLEQKEKEQQEKLAKEKKELQSQIDSKLNPKPLS